MLFLLPLPPKDEAIKASVQALMVSGLGFRFQSLVFRPISSPLAGFGLWAISFLRRVGTLRSPVDREALNEKR